MPQLTKVADTSEIPPGTGKVVEVGGKAVALFNCDGKFYAIENACKHRGGPLGEGSLSGSSVSCPWHGWEYDVRSGACQMDPAVSVQSFPVTVQADGLFVAIE
jgi:NAD(P)H-dependent nitrite reductase small subunit